MRALIDTNVILTCDVTKQGSYASYKFAQDFNEEVLGVLCKVEAFKRHASMAEALLPRMSMNSSPEMVSLSWRYLASSCRLEMWLFSLRSASAAFCQTLRFPLHERYDIQKARSPRNQDCVQRRFPGRGPEHPFRSS